MYCRQHFTENYKKLYEIWRRRNSEGRIYMEAKKLLNQKNYIFKHNKVTEMEIEEIKRELQASQTSYPEEKGKGELEHPGSMGDGEQQPSAVSTTEEKTEIHQHREQIYELKRKTESTYYRVTQMAIDNRPRLQRLHNMSKLKVILIMANEAVEEILNQTDLNITELNHLIYAAATVITEEINGTGECKPQTQRSKPPPSVRRIQGSINDIRKDPSALI
jgi:hypothetical protein